MTNQTAQKLARLHGDAFDTPWAAPAFTTLLAQSGVFWIGETDGFILCRVVVDEAEILTLAVRPTARRRGLGARLLADAARTAAAQGATRLYLEVAEDNVAARALYTRAGFATAGRRPGYYARPDGELVDALILALKLV